MELTPRVKQILNIMLKEDRIMPVKTLADAVGVSKRTIQRELGYLESDLKPYGIRFMSKPGVGVWLEGEAEKKANLALAVTQGDKFDAANKKERRKRLLLEILKDKSLKKLFHYSSQFGVSEATISSDLDVLEKWLSEQHLTIVRKPGSGISIQGSEENYRRAIRHFIDENVGASVVYEHLEEAGEKAGQMLENAHIPSLLNNDILKRVTDCIDGLNDRRILTLTENAYMGLVIHITIAINRILKNEIIEEDAPWLQKLEQDEAYILAKTIVEELEEEFEIQIPQTEISYICLHIKGAKHQRLEWEENPAVEMSEQDMQKLINEMIQEFDSERAFELRQDDEFLQGLLAHLQPTFVRLIYDMKIQNPVLEEIKRDYADIFERCRRVAKVLEAYTGRKVPETEVGFLAIHFGAALVRLDGKKEQIRQVHVGVVCSSGIGISRLMSTKLEEAFRGRMLLSTYGKNDVTPYIESKLDFFVSNLPLDVEEIPVVRVNPLLDESDIENIWQMVYRYERLPQKNAEENQFTLELAQVNLVATQIKTVIKYMEYFKVSPEISFEELLVAIGEKLSFYSDRSSQIQEDIMRRERLSSQIFAEFGFALLHTRTKGVTRPSFSVCMTRDLTSFTDEYFKGISVVFIMLIPMDGHINVNSEILGHLSGMIIEDENFLQTVRKGDKEEIRSLVSVYLKQYFTKYLAKL